MEYVIKQFPLQQGALEIEYIEELFGEFPRRKTAKEIVRRLSERQHLIVMAIATLPDDPESAVPVSYKVSHEIFPQETDPKLRDLVGRLSDVMSFDTRKVLYQWIGATRRDWRGQGHFRALTEEQEVWAVACGFDEIVAKTKNRYYGMRSTLDALRFDVIKYEAHPDNRESKVYLSKKLHADVIDTHQSRRSVVKVGE